jgi:hypothetical protein
MMLQFVWFSLALLISFVSLFFFFFFRKPSWRQWECGVQFVFLIVGGSFLNLDQSLFRVLVFGAVDSWSTNTRFLLVCYCWGITIESIAQEPKGLAEGKPGHLLPCTPSLSLVSPLVLGKQIPILAPTVLDMFSFSIEARLQRKSEAHTWLSLPPKDRLLHFKRFSSERSFAWF